MGHVLRVDPEALRKSAAAQVSVRDAVSELDAAQSISGAGAGVTGLTTEGACQFASSVVGSALSAVREDLTAHSSSLSTAADHYHRADVELGRRLRTFAP